MISMPLLAASCGLADSRLLWLLLTPRAPYIPLPTVHHPRIRTRSAASCALANSRLL